MGQYHIDKGRAAYPDVEHECWICAQGGTVTGAAETTMIHSRPGAGGCRLEWVCKDCLAAGESEPEEGVCECAIAAEADAAWEAADKVADAAWEAALAVEAEAEAEDDADADAAFAAAREKASAAWRLAADTESAAKARARHGAAPETGDETMRATPDALAAAREHLRSMSCIAEHLSWRASAEDIRRVRASVDRAKRRLTRLEAMAARDEGCAHESVTPPNGHGAFCRFCGETVA